MKISLLLAGGTFFLENKEQNHKLKPLHFAQGLPVMIIKSILRIAKSLRLPQ